MTAQQQVERDRHQVQSVPGITHVDSRRVTVDERHGIWRLKAIWAKSNAADESSFNISGEPIVCTPEKCVYSFMATDMDMLVLENFVLLKERQPQMKPHQVDQYLAKFELD